jgi:hypothetical protein
MKEAIPWCTRFCFVVGVSKVVYDGLYSVRMMMMIIIMIMVVVVVMVVLW